MIRWVRRALVIASVLGWTTSLAHVALVLSDGPVTGLDFMLMGWFGPLGGEFAWYANPTFFLAIYWMAVYKPNFARSAATVALGLAMLPLAAKTVNHGYNFVPIIHFALGYRLWLGSIALFALTALLLPRRWPYDRKPAPA